MTVLKSTGLDVARANYTSSKNCGLKQALLQEDPSLTKEIINLLINFVREKNLSWFLENQQPRFIAKKVFLAVGKKSHNLKRDIQSYKKSCPIEREFIFKQISRQEIDFLCRSVGQVYICNYVVLCSLIYENYKDVFNKRKLETFKKEKIKFSKDFIKSKTLPSTVISNPVKQITTKLKKEQIVESFCPYLYDQSESRMSDRLVNLSSYTRYPLQRELTVLNRLESKSQYRTRRFDLIRHRTDLDCFELFELKLKLNASMVTDILAIKGYLDLALRLFTKEVRFYFIANEITPEAQRLLNLIPLVNFISTKEYVISLKKEILKYTPSEGHWYFIEEIFPNY